MTTNPFLWSVRREAWEHREVWVVPLAVAALALFAVGLNVRNIQQKIGLLLALSPGKQQPLIAMPFGIVGTVILFVSFAVGAYYAFDALNAERRDRSVLFWKSMPVSDTTTVLAKAFVPLVLLPGIALAIALATQAVLAIVVAAVLSAVGVDVGRLWALLPVGVMTVTLLYIVVVHVLWYAPLYALFLMLGAWVRRPFLWVLVPAMVVLMLEHVAFGTDYSGRFIRHRVSGAMTEAFTVTAAGRPVTDFSQLDPVNFASRPGLWLGLVFAVAFLVLAIHLRRSREPL